MYIFLTKLGTCFQYYGLIPDYGPVSQIQIKRSPGLKWVLCGESLRLGLICGCETSLYDEIKLTYGVNVHICRAFLIVQQFWIKLKVS